MCVLTKDMACTQVCFNQVCVLTKGMYISMFQPGVCANQGYVHKYVCFNQVCVLTKGMYISTFQPGVCANQV